MRASSFPPQPLPAAVGVPCSARSANRGRASSRRPRSWIPASTAPTACAPDRRPSRPFGSRFPVPSPISFSMAARLTSMTSKPLTSMPARRAPRIMVQYRASHRSSVRSRCPISFRVSMARSSSPLTMASLNAMTVERSSSLAASIRATRLHMPLRMSPSASRRTWIASLSPSAAARSSSRLLACAW